MEDKYSAILKAYKGCENFVIAQVDDNGFVPKRYLLDLLCIYDYSEIEEKALKIRPKCLEGIEDNNGWIKAPKTFDKEILEGAFWVKDSIGITTAYFNNNKGYFEYVGNHGKASITHYQPIERPKQPFY